MSAGLAGDTSDVSGSGRMARVMDIVMSAAAGDGRSESLTDIVKGAREPWSLQLWYC